MNKAGIVIDRAGVLNLVKSNILTDQIQCICSVNNNFCFVSFTIIQQRKKKALDCFQVFQILYNSKVGGHYIPKLGLKQCSLNPTCVSLLPRIALDCRRVNPQIIALSLLASFNQRRTVVFFLCLSPFTGHFAGTLISHNNSSSPTFVIYIS